MISFFDMEVRKSHAFEVRFGLYGSDCVCVAIGTYALEDTGRLA